MTFTRFVASLVAVTAVSLALYFANQKPETAAKSQSEIDSQIQYQLKVRQYMREGLNKVPKAERRPSDWFYSQRAYPNKTIPNGSYREAILEAQEMIEHKRPLWDEPEWQPAGPSNIPGRVSSLDVHPSDPNTIYAGSATGGVYKSTDLGQSWIPIFDSEGCPSIGDLAIDPSNPDIVYVGTGESHASLSDYEGTGVFKSTDAGATWTWMGLPNSYHIGRVIVDPVYPDTVYVAVFGKRYDTDQPDRGVFRSPDGGVTWEQVLFVDGDVGCIDLALHPSSGVMLAAMWQRNDPNEQSGIWRSADRGDTWTDISGTNGLRPAVWGAGRIGVTIEPTTGTSYVLYATPDGDFDGLFKSTDTGQVWSRVTDGALYQNYLFGSWSGGDYFGQIRVAPGRPDDVYAMGLDVWRSIDGGASWLDVSRGPTIWDVHLDQHAMVFLETNPDVIYLGNDGGVYYSEDRGLTWTHLTSMANDQFYAIEVDPSNPERLYGGTQDNGTLRTPDGSIDGWERIFGGDGFYCQVDPTDPFHIYASVYFGYIVVTFDDGASWHEATSGIDPNERAGWSAPFLLDHNDPNVLYFGAQSVYRGVAYGGPPTWASISPYLTGGIITTVDVGHDDYQVIYCGTSRSEVFVTTDGGSNWTQINAGLPDRWITRVTVDYDDAAVVYVTLSGYLLDNDYLPHVFRSEDYGATWTDISGNLPDNPVNDLIVDYYNDSTLYVATDVGIFYTTNLGQTWSPFGVGMPIVPVVDLDYHIPTRTLIAGTYGRSMFRAVHPCTDQNDADSDGTGDECDNCPDYPNEDQSDADNDMLGDYCDPCTDPDNDGFGTPGLPGSTCPDDNCPEVANADQTDSDGDGIGDACDDCPFEPDGDGICDEVDNCPGTYNPDQLDLDGDGVGDACCCGAFNAGQTGNADCSEDGKVTLTDITRLIDHVYISKDPLCCAASGNANGSVDGKVTLADITRLIDHVYISKSPTAPCP